MSTQVLAKKQLVLIKKQADWDTPNAITASGYTLLNGINVGSSIPDPDVNVDFGNFIGQYGTTDEIGRVYIDPNSGLPKLPFSGIATLETLAPLFASIFQEVTEGASTPYDKAYVVKSKDEVIDFNTSKFLFTVLIVNFNDAGNSISDITRMINCVVSDFEFTVEPNNRGFARVAKVSGNFVASAVDYDTNSATLASYTNPTMTKLGDTVPFVLNVDTDSVAGEDLNGICFKRFSFKYDGNISVDCRGAGGVPLTFKAMQQFFFEITLPYIQAANYNTMVKNFADGKNVIVSFEYGTYGAGAPYLYFVNSLGRQIRNPLANEGDYWTRPIVIQCFSSAGTTNPVTASLVDAIDWGF